MEHREHIKKYLSNIDIGGRRVIDWGMGTKPVIRYCKGQPAFYMGLDKLDHVGATRVCDIGKEVVLNQLFEIAFCMEVLEHVPDTKQLLKNIYWNLTDGADFYLSVPFMFRVHSPEDYWRFTDQGLRLILENSGFKIIEIKSTQGDEGWIVHAKKL